MKERKSITALLGVGEHCLGGLRVGSPSYPSPRPIRAFKTNHSSRTFELSGLSLSRSIDLVNEEQQSGFTSWDGRRSVPQGVQSSVNVRAAIDHDCLGRDLVNRHLIKGIIKID